MPADVTRTETVQVYTVDEINEMIAALAPARDGIDGIDGEDGQDGEPGPPGPRGPAGPAGGGTTVLVDSLGDTDDARIAAMNAMAKAHNGLPTAAFEFAVRQYNFSTPIELWSGLKIIGTNGLPAREFGRGTILNWQGAAGTSVFKWVSPQYGQSYPGDGSPRDITVVGMLFQGGSSTDVMPKAQMNGDYAGKTLWYCNFHNCGVRNMRSFWWGYATGCSITGAFHAQAMADTVIFLGGSENTVFGVEQSLMDNSTAAWASSGKPFVRSVMEKSYIKTAMLSARGNSYQLSIEGGHDVIVDGLQVDSPSGAPTQGSPVRVTGGYNFRFTNMTFKGFLNGGVTTTFGSRAAIDIQNARWISIDGNTFLKGNPTLPATTPLVYATNSTFVKWGTQNLHDGFNGATVGTVV
jgi:hypothetical protein